MVMTIIKYLIGLGIGFIAFCYIGLQIVLTYTVSKKITKENQNAGIQARYGTIYKKMFTTVALCSFLFYILFEIIGIITFFTQSNHVKIGFFIGCTFSFVLSIKNMSVNEDNRVDYNNAFSREYAVTSSLAAHHVIPNHKTLFYKLRFLTLLLLLLPHALIDTLLYNLAGIKLGLFPTILLLMPSFFFITNWNNMFYKEYIQPAFISQNEKVVVAPLINDSETIENYTEYADGHIEYNNIQPIAETNNTLNAPDPQKQKIDNFTKFFIATTIILSAIVLFGIGYILGTSNSHSVYATKSGQYYHTSECDFTKSWSDSIIKMNVDKAIQSGYTSCPKCNP